MKMPVVSWCDPTDPDVEQSDRSSVFPAGSSFRWSIGAASRSSLGLDQREEQKSKPRDLDFRGSRGFTRITRRHSSLRALGYEILVTPSVSFSRQTPREGLPKIDCCTANGVSTLSRPALVRMSGRRGGRGGLQQDFLAELLNRFNGLHLAMTSRGSTNHLKAVLRYVGALRVAHESELDASKMLAVPPEKVPKDVHNSDWLDSVR